MREEHDYLGTMYLNDDVLYGIQTARGARLSHVTGHTLEQDGMDLVKAIAEIKQAAALANRDAGGLDSARADAIVQASEEVIKGNVKGQFPVDMITGGGGISIHMDLNEVIANRAAEISGGLHIHPNTHVNMGQSTNDVLPSAMLIASSRKLQCICGRIGSLLDIVLAKEAEYKDVVRLGRTCLQDAMPMTFGQSFSAWAAFLERQKGVLADIAADFLEIPLGGAAVGTGAGTLPGYTEAVYRYLRDITGLPVRQSTNLFDSLENDDIYIRASAALKALAAGLSKISSDLRILSSGPRGGLRELHLPAVLPGSSIMPGKMNPVLPELMIQIYFLVFGNDASITLAVERGELELNVWESVIMNCFFESCRLLEYSIPVFGESCIKGIVVDEDVCQRYAEQSTAVASVISSVYGYETGSKVARYAIDNGKSVKEAVVDLGIMTEEEAADILNPVHMTDSEALSEHIRKVRERINH